jgi:hypothetical protein
VSKSAKKLKLKGSESEKLLLEKKKNLKFSRLVVCVLANKKKSEKIPPTFASKFTESQLELAVLASNHCRAVFSSSPISKIRSERLFFFFGLFN